MCRLRALWLVGWLLWLPWACFGEVTEAERQAALAELQNIEDSTKMLQENSALRETYLTETATLQNEREALLSEREKSLSEREQSQLEREKLQNEKDRSLTSRETSLQVITTDIEKSKKLFEKQEKRFRLTKLIAWGEGLGILVLIGAVLL